MNSAIKLSIALKELEFKVQKFIQEDGDIEFFFIND